MQRFWFIAGATICGLAVMLGAFGAHMLSGKVTPARLDTFAMATRYQLAHGLALLILGLARPHLPGRLLTVAASLLLAGTVVFSGSLYLLVVLDQSWLGAVTPLGGLSLIAGWIVLIVAAARAPAASA